MIKITCRDDDWQNAETVVMSNENGKKIIRFENKSSVLGNKIWVYDWNDEEMYFIEEDVASEYNDFNMHKGDRIAATVKRSNNTVYREIIIEANGENYEFLLLHGMLLKNKKKLAKLKRHDKEGITIKIFDENEDIMFLVPLLYTIQLMLLR